MQVKIAVMTHVVGAIENNRPSMYGLPFEIHRRDHQSLRFLLRLVENVPQIQCWQGFSSMYAFNIIYKPPGNATARLALT